MLIDRLRTKAQGESGFTLVELLVVMLILGLLAAIAIPSFFNQRDKARDADAKADARTAQTAVETYATDNGGSYAAVDTGDLINIEATLTEANTEGRLSVTSTADTYTVEVDSENDPATQHFRISRLATGVTTLECDLDGTDGCPSTGLWG
jgi:type IV pilus assembly protein PilA